MRERNAPLVLSIPKEKLFSRKKRSIVARNGSEREKRTISVFINTRVFPCVRKNREPLRIYLSAKRWCMHIQYNGPGGLSRTRVQPHNVSRSLALVQHAPRHSAHKAELIQIDQRCLRTRRLVYWYANRFAAWTAFVAHHRHKWRKWLLRILICAQCTWFVYTCSMLDVVT